MTIKRLGFAAAAVLATALFAASPAVAAPPDSGNPHFIGNAMSASVDADFDLTVMFKEAGLPSGQLENIVATAGLEATYQCINGGGGNPSDAKKTTIDVEVSASDVFPAGKNGQLTGSLTIAVMPADQVLDCPSGQTATLTAGTYSDIFVEDLTSGATYSFGGLTFSFGAPVGHGHK